MPQRAHRRGAGVVGLAGEDEFHAGLSDDGARRRRGAAFAFEHRALLDVELEIARRRSRRCAAAGSSCGVEAEVADGLGDGDAVAIGARERRRVEFADEREAAEERLGEAHALLFGEADDFDREGQRLSRCSSSTSATPSTTPRMPSKAPALGTVSRCEPMSRRGASGSDAAQQRRADCRRRRRGLSCRRRASSRAAARGRDAWRERERCAWSRRGLRCRAASSRQRAMIARARAESCPSIALCGRSSFAPHARLDVAGGLVGGDEDLVGIVLAEAREIDEQAVLVGHDEVDLVDVRHVLRARSCPSRTASPAPTCSCGRRRS